MLAKVLAGLMAAIAVTVVGVYAAFGTGTRDRSTECSLAVSEGSCCALAAQAAPCCSLMTTTCHTDEGQPVVAESVAACVGGSALAMTTTTDLTTVE